MKKFTILLFTAILSFAFLVAPGILEARGGHGGRGGGRGGHHGGFHGGHHGGFHGGSGLDFMEADSMEDPVIMADLLSALARHTISPHGGGIILGTTRNTTTTFLRPSMINPLLLRHLPLSTLSLHQLLKVLVLVMFYLLHLRPARFHQILFREDVKFGRRPGSFTMNQAGIHRSK